MAKTFQLFSKKYTDVDFVEGMYKHDRRIERALFDHCQEYYDEKYGSVFFAGDEKKHDIFQESFMVMWKNIMQGKLYVENGVLYGGGEPFKAKLTTYFMSIAMNKFKEWLRDNPHATYTDEELAMAKQLYDQWNADTDVMDEREKMFEILEECIANMPNHCRQILTMFYYEMKSLDRILDELASYLSKDALKTAKYKCMERLKTTANEVYDGYLAKA